MAKFNLSQYLRSEIGHYGMVSKPDVACGLLSNWPLPFIKQSTAVVGMCNRVFVSPTEKFSPNDLDVNVHMTFYDD